MSFANRFSCSVLLDVALLHLPSEASHDRRTYLASGFLLPELMCGIGILGYVCVSVGLSDNTHSHSQSYGNRAEEREAFVSKGVSPSQAVPLVLLFTKGFEWSVLFFVLILHSISVVFH
jgi:hypothetical protein